MHGTRVAAVPEPLFEAKDVGLRVVDALQKTLKAMQTGEPQPEAPTSGAELKTNFEATNGGGEGPINVKVAVRGVELLVLGTWHPLHFSSSDPKALVSHRTMGRGLLQVGNPRIRRQDQCGAKLHEHLP